jgi:integrase
LPAIVVYARTKDSYITFITSEAFEYVQNWLEKRKNKGETITNESLVFPRTSNDYSVYFSMLHRRINLSEKITNQRRKIKAVHGLRKRFDTILKSKNDVNPNLAERLMGHSVSIALDNAYFRPSEQSLFETYQKIIPDLIMSDRYQLKNELAQKDEQIKTLQNDKDQRIKELEQKLEMISHHLSNLSTKA